jgi:hypothetical protein
MLQTGAIPFQGLLTFQYHGYFDSEPDYDQTHVEYDAGAGNWVEIALYDGVVDTVAIHELLLSQRATKLRFHFTADGAWSDQDGLWDTDGAFIVDEITVSDIGGVINYEDFEAHTVCVRDVAGDPNDNSDGIWYGDVEQPFGNYSGLANKLADKDPCGDNFATQVVFFIGSPYPSSEYPGLFDVPFCSGPGGIEAPCHDEAIISPIIDMNTYSSNCNCTGYADSGRGSPDLGRRVPAVHGLPRSSGTEPVVLHLGRQEHRPGRRVSGAVAGS